MQKLLLKLISIILHIVYEVNRYLIDIKTRVSTLIFFAYLIYNYNSGINITK